MGSLTPLGGGGGGMTIGAPVTGGAAHDVLYVTVGNVLGQDANFQRNPLTGDFWVNSPDGITFIAVAVPGVTTIYGAESSTPGVAGGNVLIQAGLGNGAGAGGVVVIRGGATN